MEGSQSSDRAAVDAIVVLGCKVLDDARPSRALARRIRLAARAHAAGVAPLVVASGGRLWGDASEAACIAAGLHAAGVPRKAIVPERCSLNTAENAHYCAAWLRSQRQRAPQHNNAPQYNKIMLCTCPWHYRRAAGHFERYGVTTVPPPREWYELAPQPWWRPHRERVTALLDRTVLAVVGVRPTARTL